MITYRAYHVPIGVQCSSRVGPAPEDAYPHPSIIPHPPSMFTPDQNTSGDGDHSNPDPIYAPASSYDVARLIRCILHYSPNQAVATATPTAAFNSESNQYPTLCLATLFTSLPPPNISTIQENYEVLSVVTNAKTNSALWGFAEDKAKH